MIDQNKRGCRGRPSWENVGIFLVYIHLRRSLKISGGNVNEEDGGYLKMEEGAYNNKYLYSAFL